MWPFKHKSNLETDHMREITESLPATVADGIDWKQILSEGKTVELFDGCRAKCDGGFEDL